MAFFAHDVLNAELPGSYRPVRAEHFARCVLMPDAEFRALAWHSDATLAEHFVVPIEQIAEKRLDLEALEAARR
jgi:Zn-dependent peptidase ImmA (M78 family)